MIVARSAGVGSTSVPALSFPWSDQHNYIYISHLLEKVCVRDNFIPHVSYLFEIFFHILGFVCKTWNDNNVWYLTNFDWFKSLAKLVTVSTTQNILSPFPTRFHCIAQSLLLRVEEWIPQKKVLKNRTKTQSPNCSWNKPSEYVNTDILNYYLCYFPLQTICRVNSNFILLHRLFHWIFSLTGFNPKVLIPWANWTISSKTSAYVFHLYSPRLPSDSTSLTPKIGLEACCLAHHLTTIDFRRVWTCNNV